MSESVFQVFSLGHNFFLIYIWRGKEDSRSGKTRRKYSSTRKAFLEYDGRPKKILIIIIFFIMVKKYRSTLQAVTQQPVTQDSNNNQV